jgi:DNA-binding protein HU-beta
MNRTELVSAIAAQTGSTATAVDQILAGLSSVITEQLVKGEKVTIPGFVTFETADRAARTGRNPQTGETLQIAAKRAVKVSAGQSLTRAVAGN